MSGKDRGRGHKARKDKTMDKEARKTEAVTRKVIVLKSGTMGRTTDAIVADEAHWMAAASENQEKQVMVTGHMVDQDIAHNWLDGRDMQRLDSQRDDKSIRRRWKSFWQRNPERTYQVPASEIAYTEVIADNSARLGITMGNKEDKPCA